MNQCGFAGAQGKVNVGPMRDPWFLLRSGPGAPDFNMAADQALLESVASLGRPVLRFYSWTVPAATFGYFQRHADVAALTALRPLVRRSTGGGLVPHDADWTYSIAVPPSHPWYSLAATESYARVHRWLRDAFARVDVPTLLAPVADPSGPGQCFVGAEESDLLFRGRKIAGAAQRRNRLGLLVQGSVQPPPGPDRPRWEQAMLDAANELAGVIWTPFPDVDSFTSAAQELAGNIYGTAAHNEHR